MLYASLPNDDQSKAFMPALEGTRKCILATNIAETSITIPGVKYVIDTGKQKEKRHLSAAKGKGMFALYVSLLCTFMTGCLFFRRRRAPDGRYYEVVRGATCWPCWP
jgi:hypothetical protein